MCIWPPIGKIAAHSAYEMFSWYKYLIVSLVFSHLGFWSGNLFLIAPFPDLCLLVPFYIKFYIDGLVINIFCVALFQNKKVQVGKDLASRCTTDRLQASLRTVTFSPFYHDPLRFSFPP